MSVPCTSNSAARVTRQAEAVLGQVKILDNPFFRALQSGEMDRDAFQKTQHQFYFAVLEFPRPMLALLCRLPRPELRLGILENVVEEHGHFEPRAFHEATFREFCNALAGSNFDPSGLQPGPVVAAFNNCLLGACQSAELSLGMACLGIIEYAFADLSAFLGQTVVGKNWVPAERLVHYKLHAEIDRQHAADFFHPLESLWDEPREQVAIQRGLWFGAYVFDRLYCDLWRSAQGQWGG